MRYQSLQSVTVNLMVPLLPLPVLQNQLCMMWLKIIILWTIKTKDIFLPKWRSLLLILLCWHLRWLQQREMKINKLEGVLKATGGPQFYSFKWIFPRWIVCLLWLSFNCTITAFSASQVSKTTTLYREILNAAVKAQPTILHDAHKGKNKKSKV